MAKKKSNKYYNLLDLKAETESGSVDTFTKGIATPLSEPTPEDDALTAKEQAQAQPIYGLECPIGYQFATPMNFAPNEPLVVDVETTGLKRFDNIVGVGIMSLVTDQGTYIPYAHKLGPNIERESAIRYLKKMLERPSTKILFNQKFDIGMLAKDDIVLGGETHDPMFMASLLNENRMSYQLKRLANEDCGMPPTEQNLLKDWLVRNGFKEYMVWEAPAELVGLYCYGDLVRTKALYMKYKDELYAQEHLSKVYTTECRLSPVLLISELHGCRLDEAALNRDQKELTNTVSDLTQQTQELVGSSMFNPASGQHLANAYDRFGIPYFKTEKGNPCFDYDSLVKLKASIPDLPGASEESKSAGLALTDTIVKLRENASNLKFVEGFLEFNQNGRLYPNWNAMRGEKGGAVTGRMSSDDPNLQNIPEPSRKYFLPDFGKVWIGLDYSQIEYRIFAHYANDPKIINAYRENPWTDFHQMCADMMGIERKPAKAINFGLLYAMGKGKLAEDLGMTVMQAEPLFINYHSKFPCVRKLRREVEDGMRRRGYIRNLFGRYRRLKGKEEYKSLNSLIQGSAADLLKYSALRVYAEACYPMNIVPLLYIHDEIIFQMEEKQVDEFLHKAVPVMQDFPQIKVPIRIDVAMFRENWSKEIKINLEWNK